MQPSLLRDLHARRFATRARWEALLRAEPVTTPLGYPDALVHLIDSTLEEVLHTLAKPVERPPHAATPHRARIVPGASCEICPCGRNPLLAYFSAGGQALRECLVLAQASATHLDPVERDTALEELNQVLDHISHREIGAFCGVCQFRNLALFAPMEPFAVNRG